MNAQAPTGATAHPLLTELREELVQGHRRARHRAAEAGRLAQKLAPEVIANSAR